CFPIHPDDIDPGDMDVDAVRNRLAVHFRTEQRILKDQILRYDAGFDDVALAVNVFEVGIDGVDPLLQPAMQKLPFLGGEDPRDDIEWDQALLSFGIAVDGKGNADAAEHHFGLAPAQIEQIRFDAVQPARQFGIGRPNGTAHIRASRHFVEHDDPAHYYVDEQMLSNLRAKGTPP